MSATDAACYRVPPVVVEIAVVKLVNGEDANTPASGPVLTPGAPVTWTYVGDEPGHGAAVERDCRRRQRDARQHRATTSCATFTGGDTNGDGLLDPGETWTYTASGTVGTTDYCNVGDRERHNGTTVSRHGSGVLPGAAGRCVEIAVVKLVNGEDANTPRRSGVDAGCGGDVDVCR